MNRIAMMLALLTSGHLAGYVHAQSLAPRPVPYESTLSYKIDACERVGASLAAMAQAIDDEIKEDPQIKDDGARDADANARRKPFRDRLLHVSKYCQGVAVASPAYDDWRFVQALASRKANTKFSLTSTQTWTALGGSASGASGASWSSTLIDGATAFLVKRARDELVASFVAKLKGSLCGGKVAELLPSSCAVMASFTPKSFPQVGAAIRAALRDDVANLAQRLTARRCGPALVANLAFELHDHLERGSSPFEALAALASIDVPACGKQPEFLRALAALGTGVRLLIKGHAILPSVPELWRREWTTTVGNVLCPATVANCSSPPISSEVFERLHLSLLRQESLRAQLGEKSETATYNAYARGLSELLVFAAELSPDATNRLEDIRAILLTVAKLRDSLRGRDYASVVVALLELVDRLEKMPSATELLPSSLRGHIPFLTELAVAEKPEDFARAIEAAAVPIGTWSQKRLADTTTVGVNAYLGIRVGGERLGGSGGVEQHMALEGGLFAPIGFEVSRGLGGVSLGVMLSVVDLGALVSYRITNPETKSENGQQTAKADDAPSYSARQLLSPGMHVVLGISRGVPLTVGFGIALTPDLRDVRFSSRDDDPTAEPVTRNEAVTAFRIGAFASIDLPILQF